jgi:hypothetical protein
MSWVPARAIHLWRDADPLLRRRRRQRSRCQRPAQSRRCPRGCRRDPAGDGKEAPGGPSSADSARTQEEGSSCRAANPRRRSMSGRPWWTADGRCTHCDLPRTAQGHDPCIANLPRTFHACCGHGHPQGMLYLTTRDGYFWGEVAIEKMRQLGANPPPFCTKGIELARLRVAGGWYNRALARFARGREVVRQGRSERTLEKTIELWACGLPRARANGDCVRKARQAPGSRSFAPRRGDSARFSPLRPLPLR